MRDIIEINKGLIPYSFEILLGGEMFEIGVNYNNTAELFTLSLKKDGEVICAGEPVIYGQKLWQSVYQPNMYPSVDIVPLDESGNVNAVTYDNLNETVFLTIDDGGGENE